MRMYRIAWPIVCACVCFCFIHNGAKATTETGRFFSFAPPVIRRPLSSHLPPLFYRHPYYVICELISRSHAILTLLDTDPAPHGLASYFLFLSPLYQTLKSRPPKRTNVLLRQRKAPVLSQRGIMRQPSARQPTRTAH